ncbi:FAD-dependent oxidoreductase [Roseomonas fluvialis]|uniref:(2Fe-2S)-binding protein n=1 Tax=Roseomonas fluvialis TaxID=1750527 RepID=A0ABN6PCU6_9PROT|nr:FAD-dependent oxidoreductase [Roseomonas fluvialis]BDG75158.1 (2Fe-2S)-binding protein [Roseomonas fluvialis]
MMHDVAVLGGGPAGMAAATEAASRGARTVLLEESPLPGGQVYRAPPAGFTLPADADRRTGDALRAALAASGAELRTGCRVWGLGGGPLVPQGSDAAPFTLSALGADGVPFTVTARALVLCTGTHERIIPFPGWTLPGVIGLAAATILLKAQGVLPGRRVVVAGVGPLLYAVAAKVLAGGGKVVAVVDAATRGEWLRALPGLAARPDLLAQGAAWRAKLVAARVPVLHGATVTAAEGDGVLARVRVGDRCFDADALCIGHGLVPATEATRTYRARHEHRAQDGGWVPVLDARQRTSVTLLYAAGDGAGVRGAAAAPAAGRVAARAALQDLGLAPEAPEDATLARARRAGAAMAGIMALRPAMVAVIPPDTIICRCEGVARAAIDAAAADGAATLNQLKHFTRCGMGPCQGRMCGEAAGALLAAARGVPVAHVGFSTGRIPLRPVPMEAILGAFDYADIPVPAAAPI